MTTVSRSAPDQAAYSYSDPLIHPVLPPAAEPRLDLRMLPVGRCEDGNVWELPLAGAHVLLAGATGSGKSGLLYSMLYALAPEVASGRVRLIGIDPKGGMELLPARSLFTKLAVDDFEAMAALLDWAVDVMQRRATRLAAAGVRSHEPSVEEPLLVVVIDELATLTAYLRDRKASQHIANTLGMILTKGRAVGVCVVAALQDPRKEVVGFRNLFPCRVALRLDDATHVDMVLGDGASDQGARCYLIPRSQAGVGLAAWTRRSCHELPRGEVRPALADRLIAARLAGTSSRRSATSRIHGQPPAVTAMPSVDAEVGL